MLHTWLLCQCYSLSIACSCVDDSCVWVAPPAFRGTQHILTHWFILRIIEAVCLMLLHCSTSFLSHLVTDVSKVCLQCSRNVCFSLQQRWLAWSFLFSERLFSLLALKKKVHTLKKRPTLAYSPPKLSAISLAVIFFTVIFQWWSREYNICYICLNQLIQTHWSGRQNEQCFKSTNRDQMCHFHS